MDEAGGLEARGGLSGQHLVGGVHGLFAGRSPGSIAAFSAVRCARNSMRTSSSFRSLLDAHDCFGAIGQKKDSPVEPGAAVPDRGRTTDTAVRRGPSEGHRSSHSQTREASVASAAGPACPSQTPIVPLPDPGSTLQSIAQEPRLREAFDSSVDQPRRLSVSQLNPITNRSEGMQSGGIDDVARAHPFTLAPQDEDIGLEHFFERHATPPTQAAPKLEQPLRATDRLDSPQGVGSVSDRKLLEHPKQDADQEIAVETGDRQDQSSRAQGPSLEASPPELLQGWPGLEAHAAPAKVRASEREFELPASSARATLAAPPALDPARSVPRNVRPAEPAKTVEPVPHGTFPRPKPAVEYGSGTKQSTAFSSVPVPAGNIAASSQTSNPLQPARSLQPVAAEKISSEPFAALDKEVRTIAPVWTSSNKAEAGFRDPTLGWVSVRAQLDSTGVHATVVPASVDASLSLVGHLTSLSTYLSEHHTRIESLTLAPPESPAAPSSSSQAGDHAAGQREGQNQAFRSPAEAPENSRASFDSVVRKDEEPQETIEPIPFGFADKGLHISLIV